MIVAVGVGKVCWVPGTIVFVTVVRQSEGEGEVVA